MLVAGRWAQCAMQGCSASRVPCQTETQQIEATVFFRLQVWQSAASGSSPLFTPATLGRLGDADAALVPPLAGTLLMQHGQRLDAAGTGTVCRALVLAGLHHCSASRRAAAETVLQCVAAAPSVAGELTLRLHASTCCWLFRSVHGNPAGQQ